MVGFTDTSNNAGGALIGHGAIRVARTSKESASRIPVIDHRKTAAGDTIPG
jgi:hypothetical protein